MEHNFSTATGTLTLTQVTPVITALFNCFALNPKYPGNGQAYICIDEESGSPWDLETLQGLLDSALGQAMPADLGETQSTERWILSRLGAHFGAEAKIGKPAFEKLLDDVVHDYSNENGQDITLAFDLAQVFDDGHGLASMEIEGAFFSTKPLLGEFGGYSHFISKDLDHLAYSSDEAHFNSKLGALLAEQQDGSAADELVKRLDASLNSIKDGVLRSKILHRIEHLYTQRLLHRDMTDFDAHSMADIFYSLVHSRSERASPDAKAYWTEVRKRLVQRLTYEG